MTAGRHDVAWPIAFGRLGMTAGAGSPHSPRPHEAEGRFSCRAPAFLGDLRTMTFGSSRSAPPFTGAASAPIRRKDGNDAHYLAADGIASQVSREPVDGEGAPHVGRSAGGPAGDDDG